ncbi:MAG: hypothetical protein M0Z79_01680 [Nitrospiraceae bacterium]|nr:hypothetical protein [Nitrospiraceae bacterium]
MNDRETAWNRLKWKLLKQRLGYTDEEMALFKSNARNEDVLDKGIELEKRKIIMQVVESRGCNSQHKTGDRFVFDGAGNLLTRENPEKICIYALSACTTMIFSSNELFYAGVNPNDMRFRRAGCFDVGVQCGGWGRIVIEMSMTEKTEV